VMRTRKVTQIKKMKSGPIYHTPTSLRTS